MKPALDGMVAAGVPPAVEPGVSPGGLSVGTVSTQEGSTAGPGGKMPPSTAGETPAATPLAFTECVSEPKGGLGTSPDSRQMAKRLSELIEQIQTQPNPSARALLQECLQSLLSFYGDGLARILEQVQGGGPEGQKVLERLLQDKAVSALLLIHGLHPLDLQTRLHRALDSVRPYMQSHGGNVELLSLENDFARLRLEGTCKSCPSSTVTLELAVRHAIEEACPDLLGFEVENPAAAAGNTSEP